MQIFKFKFKFINIYSILFIFYFIIGLSSITSEGSDLIHLKPLTRFWTNTGFCPPAPLTHLNITDFFLSDDVLMNLDVISSLPNDGLKFIRIHWLLDMIEFRESKGNGDLDLNFNKLDQLLDHIKESDLLPNIEFMSFSIPTGNKYTKLTNWEDFTHQFIQHYIDRYGVGDVLQWKFETWNEPDLVGYNLLNFTLKDYLEYVHGVRSGLNVAFNKNGNSRKNWKLNVGGPAGLFKQRDHHQFCWGLLNNCNEKPFDCPIDYITYHRKGNGVAWDVLNGTYELLKKIYREFPNLRNISYSNTESDPTVGWSKPLESNADLRYALTLIMIVFEHWNATYNNTLFNLQSISHDNAFLSYHPYEFNQRTLLARFQMNLTHPPHSQFIEKPVYAALGLLSFAGQMAGPINLLNNGIYSLVTRSISTMISTSLLFYLCIFLINNNYINKKVVNNLQSYEINLNGMLEEAGNLTYFIEFIQRDVTDPYQIWKRYGKPAYPNRTVLNAMRNVQRPQIYRLPEPIPTNQRIEITIANQSPWMYTIRICSRSILKPNRVANLRIRAVGNSSVLILWSDDGLSENKCLFGYEVYFLPDNNVERWIHLNKNVHVPFLSYQFDGVLQTGNEITAEEEMLNGYYRVRAVDVFERKGGYSNKIHYKLQVN